MTILPDEATSGGTSDFGSAPAEAAADAPDAAAEAAVLAAVEAAAEDAAGAADAAAEEAAGAAADEDSEVAELLTHALSAREPTVRMEATVRRRWAFITAFRVGAECRRVKEHLPYPRRLLHGESVRDRSHSRGASAIHAGMSQPSVARLTPSR